jgi:hypothetical protein
LFLRVDERLQERNYEYFLTLIRVLGLFDEHEPLAVSTTHCPCWFLETATGGMPNGIEWRANSIPWSLTLGETHRYDKTVKTG